MGLLKNASFMSVAVLISRILGLVRESVFALLFGAGVVSDAYIAAFRIPNLFRDLFAEGALSSAFVSVFAREKNIQNQKQMAKAVMTVSALVVGMICIGIFFSAEFIVDLMVPSFRLVEGKFELTVTLTRILSPFLLFISCAALAMGVLNTRGSFFIPALGAAAFNLSNVLIGGGLALVFLSRGIEAAIVAFTVGTLAGSFFQWGTQWRELKKQGFHPLAGFVDILRPRQIQQALKDSSVIQVALIMAPSVLSVAAVQINVLVATNFASALGSGPVSWLSYAYRIMHFPMGVFGVALSAATLPRLAGFLANKDTKGFDETLGQALRWTLILAIGSAAGLVFFREMLVSLLYERGRFDSHDTWMTAQALMAYAFGLIAFNCTKIFVQAFYAYKKVWIPSFVSISSIILHYFLCLHFSQSLGHMGLALSTSLIGFLNALVLAVILKYLGVHFQIDRMIKMLFVCVVGVVAMSGFYFLGIPEWIMSYRRDVVQSSWSKEWFVFLFYSLLLVCVAGSAYLATIALFDQEARVLSQKLRDKIFKRRNVL